MKRREVLTGLLAGTAALALPSGGFIAVASAGQETTKLLRIVRRTIEVNGRAASVFGLEGSDGLPGLRMTEGEAFDVLLRNETGEGTVVHWHGLTPPWDQDGVPDAPMPLLTPSEERAYQFPVGRAGTHWMHAHTLQEQALLAAPLIVADREPADEQEVVVLLHDFAFRTPEELLAELTGPGGHGMGHGGHGGHGAMPMSGPGMAMDLNDIEYDAYLANDRTLDDPEVFEVDAGGRVRVRIINGATATAFTIDFGRIEGELIAVDGQPIVPIRGRRFPMTMGQRIDVRLDLPREASAFPILALREGSTERTGFVLRPSRAAVTRLATSGDETGPVLDLALESRLWAAEPLLARRADRSYDMALTGGMMGYEWGLPLTEPILVDTGDRVEVTMRNVSTMAHPMHLHGHQFQAVAINGQRLSGAVRDTVLLPPDSAVTIAVDAGNPGQWAFHCHHLYHMATGMMATFGYRT